MATVLIADDDPIFRYLMNQYLTRKGYTVIEDVSGKKVLEHIQEYQPIACFIDIVMADKEGLETITEIRGLSVKPILIAVSSDTQYLEWATDLGAHYTLAKPIMMHKIDALLNMIDN